MSHIVQIQTEVRDPAAVHAACNRLKLPSPSMGTFRLYSGSVSGLGVQLPGWRYPAVCELATGSVRYDNFNGRWGDQKHLDSFLQAFAVEKAASLARQQGYSVSEQALEDGSIRISIQVGSTG